ncbi:MAG: BON domain-containing protein [Pirellulaceae bacterium]
MVENLKASGYRGLHHVVCQHHAGVAILHGRVPSFYMKQLAQVLAGKVPGVDGIVNHLTVDDATCGH